MIFAISSFFAKIDSIVFCKESGGIFTNPKDKETPITLYILIKPFRRGFSVSSDKVRRIDLNDTGYSKTPFSFAISKTPAIVNGLFFDSNSLCNLSLNGASSVCTASVVIFSISES